MKDYISPAIDIVEMTASAVVCTSDNFTSEGFESGGDFIWD